MLKKYILLFLLPLSMTSFGQSLHAEQDASENTQKTLNEEIQQAPKKETQQVLSKETISKNLDIEKASLLRRFFAGGSTVILGLVVSLLIVAFVLERFSVKKLLGNEATGDAKSAFFDGLNWSLGYLLFSVLSGFMSFNAPFNLKIVDKNGEDTTFLQRFWYAFSFWLLTFVCHIIQALYLYSNPKYKDNDNICSIFFLAPFVTLFAQLVLVAITKKTISEYVTGMQVVKKKPSAPVKK